MRITDRPVLIGELLVAADIVSRQRLSTALQLATQQKLRIGQVMLMLGHLTESQLRASLSAQSLIRDGLLDFDTAVTALKVTIKENVKLGEALKKLGWLEIEKQPTNKLGELLVDANIITKAQLTQALKTSDETALPLGRVLVLTKIISEELLMTALNAQIFIRNGKLSRTQAIEGLKAASKRYKSSSGKGLPPGEVLRLGELLMSADIISKEDLMYALETGLMNEQPLGRILIEMSCIDEALLEKALTLKNMLSQGTLNKNQAVEVLKRVFKKGVAVDEAVTAVGLLEEGLQETISLDKLLALSGCALESDIARVIERGVTNAAIIGTRLLLEGIITPEVLNASLRCQFLLAKRLIDIEHGIIALNYCQRNKTCFDKALEELGWLGSAGS